jgi:hypothetical protein
LPALAGYMLFVNVFKHNHRQELLIWACGLFPAIQMMILYYLLWLFPSFSDGFYLFIPFILMTLGLFFHKQTEQRNLKIYDVAILFLIICISGVWAFLKPLTEHDTIEYALQGKHFFMHHAIAYLQVPFHSENGFYFVGKHGFLFPLIFTWESMMNELLNNERIFVFKMNNLYYSGLLIWFIYIKTKVYTEKHALIITSSIALSIGFVFNSLQFHPEMMRQFFFFFMLIIGYQTIVHKHLHWVVLMGVTAGISSNIHSINAIAAIFMILAYFSFTIISKEKNVWRNVGVITTLFFISGMIHYLIDLIWGTGWILNA